MAEKHDVSLEQAVRDIIEDIRGRVRGAGKSDSAAPDQDDNCDGEGCDDDDGYDERPETT